MFPGVDKVVEALLRGQESANRLKTVLEHARTSLVPTEPLFDTVLDSFSLALSLFTNLTSSSPQLHRRNTAALMARKSPKKKSYTEDALEHYRDHSQNPIDNDGFCWRKYGQKKIKNSTYLRCYYRCAYAKDRNCNATKRVQQIQENPPVYKTTYVGKHICEVGAFSQPNDDITDGSKMIQFDKIDQTRSESVMPQLVSLGHQAITITDKGTDQIMNQEYDNNNELLVDDDDQFLAYQFPPYSPGSFMFLDDISAFDYNPLQV